MQEFIPSSCILVDCGIPNNMTNSMTSYNLTHVGQQVNYSCSPGYMFSDLAEGHQATCLQDGNWTQIQATCDGKEQLETYTSCILLDIKHK